MKVTFGTYDSGRSYSIVALQQGRVQTDSDSNEAEKISKNSRRFSFGIATYSDGFERPKPQYWFHSFVPGPWDLR
jgi:hypothetical protein